MRFEVRQDNGRAQKEKGRGGHVVRGEEGEIRRRRRELPSRWRQDGTRLILIALVVVYGVSGRRGCRFDGFVAWVDSIVVRIVTGATGSWQSLLAMGTISGKQFPHDPGVPLDIFLVPVVVAVIELPTQARSLLELPLSRASGGGNAHAVITSIQDIPNPGLLRLLRSCHARNSFHQFTCMFCFVQYSTVHQVLLASLLTSWALPF